MTCRDSASFKKDEVCFRASMRRLDHYFFSVFSLNEMKSATTFPGDRSRDGNAAVRDRSDAKTADDPVSWTIREEGYMTRL